MWEKRTQTPTHTPKKEEENAMRKDGQLCAS